MKDETPDALFEHWPNGPEQPNKWMRAFATKMVGMKTWLTAMKDNKVFTSRLSLGDFLYPEVYLNALRQKTCRHLDLPLDKLELYVEFSGGSESAFSDYCLNLKGLILQGCEMG